MCRETCADDNDLGGGDHRHVAEQVIVGERHVEVLSSVTQLAEKTVGLWSPLRVVRRIETLHAIPRAQRVS